MSDNHDGFLLEVIDTKLDQILEGLSTKASAFELREVKDRVINVENKVDLLTLIVKEEAEITRNHTSTLTDHEIRITDLEDEDNLEYA